MGQKIPAQKQGRRVCLERGCGTIISRYNLSEWCFAHDQDVFINYDAICEDCGDPFRYQGNGGSPKRFCSDRCRQTAQRAKRRSA
jgi:hypothetical protein